MKRFLGSLGVMTALLIALNVAGCSSVSVGEPEHTTMVLDTVGTSASSESDASETTEPTTPTPSPTPKTVLVSFAGDVTLTEHVNSTASNNFDKTVNGDMEYCFQNCREIFENDDMTLVNLECAVTDNRSHADKQFVFGMKPEDLEMLNLASIECVNLANNHTRDFLEEGYTETKSNLDDYGIVWSDQNQTAIYETENGVRIGMFGLANNTSVDKGITAINQLKSDGADIIIASCHWGVEGTYTQTAEQTSQAHRLIDAGADIVIGTHPHRLQPIEIYNGKYICYSLSNFCFGGNISLSDPDSVIIQCEFLMDAEGTSCVDYKLNVIPYSQTSTRPGNDFCPKPYEWGTTEYYRVLKRLGWSQEDE